MIVPPTSLLITQAAIDQIQTEANARFYAEDLRHIHNAVVVYEDGTVRHGELFVAAAIFLKMEFIRVTPDAEYTPMGNPCAEIVLGATEVCSLGRVDPASAANYFAENGYRRPYTSFAHVRSRRYDRGSGRPGGSRME